MRLLSSEERIAALDHGMKEVLYLGKEVAGVCGGQRPIQRADASALETLESPASAASREPRHERELHDSPDGVTQCAPLTPTDVVFWQSSLHRFPKTVNL
jgi:hypothetical protein